jgi:ATP-dependent helicase/nuclease subunit A
MGAPMPNKTNWTEAQIAGIQTVDRSLLVSAAAGSGKTTVLAQRCVHLICDTKSPCSIDELLVVTFTEMAAAEMKARIHKALADRHAEEPTPHTARQLAIIDRASVGTLHGFCARLLRQHFHLLGLDPNFLILDPDETDLLKLETARELFAERYDRDDADAFRSFIDSYGEGSDQQLVHLLLRAHDTLCSVLDSRQWMARARQRITQAIELPFNETDLGKEFGQSILRYLKSMRAECIEAGKAIKNLARFPEYVSHLRDLYQTLNHWVTVFETHGLDALVDEAATVELPDLPRVSSKIEGKEIAKVRVDAIRTSMKKGSWRQCLLFTAAEWKDGLTRILPHLDTFLSLVEEFGARYSQAKDDEGGLDFSDLERLTLRVLRDTGAATLSPSPVAKFYHQQFQHVLVDEYQDINEVQDAILTLISRECLAPHRKITPNLFCVGDVKQSIYRFRLAEAQRFLQRRENYSQLNSHGLLVDLQQNFRSRAPLLEAINGVFEKLMTAEAADLNYDESQRLKPGLAFPETNGFSTFTGAPIELHLLPADVTMAEGSDEDRSDREAALLAHRILEIKNSMHVIDRTSGTPTPRPVRFGDIVILMRSLQFKADQFAQGLRNAGIPVHSESATGYFEATEINDVLSLLKVLDNQRQDIPLAAFLRSPLADLPDAEDNLVRIHLAYAVADPPIPFHQAVIRYANEQKDELAARLRDLRKKLDDWRKLARRRPLAQVLWTIYDETGYLAFCAGLRGGEQRQANLVELHERARQFGSFRRQGLSRFLEFLEKLKSDSDLGQASVASQAEDVVRIMSIHRSKGLEFPIVLLPDLGKLINLRDCQGSILLDRSAGLGLQVVDEQRQARYPSLAWTVVQNRLRQQALAEELRVLYVAMTRAKEHLILVGTCNETQVDKWTGQWTGHIGPLPSEVVLSARSMLDWIGPAAAATSPAIQIQTHTIEEITAWSIDQTNPPGVHADLVELKPLTPPPPPSGAADEIIDRVCHPYPFEKVAKEAAAKSVTSLAKDGDWTPGIFPSLTTETALDRTLRKPTFLVDDVPPDAADRGTATHAVLEHLDFTDASTLPAIQRQIENMVASRRITPQQAASVDVETIIWLLNEPVGKLLSNPATKLHRELAVYFTTPSTEPMDQPMIRGRLDVLIEHADGLIIVDYKTDRVSGSGVDQRAEFYQPQMRLYREAIERITNKQVTETMLVFLYARECRTA